MYKKPDTADRYDFDVTLTDTDGKEVDRWSTRYPISDRVANEKDRFWEGEKLFVKDTAGDIPTHGDTFEVYTISESDGGAFLGSFVDTVKLDDERQPLIDTANREGKYVVVNGSEDVFSVASDGGLNINKDEHQVVDNEQSSFSIPVQSLTTAFDDTEVEQENRP